MANMDTIVIVSPGYLDAVKSCLNRYNNFCIAGYSDVYRAIEALQHIPGADILGVAYLNDSVREEDVEGLRLLTNKVNIIFQDIKTGDQKPISVPFIYLLSTKMGGKAASSDHVKSILNDVGTDNLNIGYYNYDIATDTVIKVQMFGTILLKRRPFEVTHPEIAETINNPNHLKIELPFEKKFIEIYEPLSMLEVDDYILKYPRERTLCLIRSYMYKPSEELMIEIMKNLAKLPFQSRMPYDSILRNLNLIER